MGAEQQIRADYDRDTLVVYQAYAPEIAAPAVACQRFAAPFSFQRMTWIKPSFLWLMHRSQWGCRRGQERTLAIRITRAGWERALSLGVLTHPAPAVFAASADWETQFAAAPVHIQWDTERSLRGAPENRGSIQVGIGRSLIREYVDTWIVSITDLSPRVARIRDLLRQGDQRTARRLLPPERIYPVSQATGRRILASE